MDELDGRPGLRLFSYTRMSPINYELEVAKYQERKETAKRMAAQIETRAADSDLKSPSDWLINALLGQVQSKTGIIVTPMKLMGIATVFACLRIHMETMASMPCILQKGDGKDGYIEARDHRLYHVMRRAPNNEMTAYDFIAAMQGNLAGRQNAYAEILRDIDGDPIGLYPTDPSYWSVYRDSRTYKLVYEFQNGERFSSKDIFHLRGVTRIGLIGADLSSTLQEVFALALALQENAASFFGNGSRPGAILEHPAVMSEPAQERLKKQIVEQTSGANANSLLMLEEGLKFAKSRSENKDSQFQEAREYQDLQICRIYRVPPHKVGIMSGQPRANIEEENLAFVADVARPQCVNWEQQLDMKLLTIEEAEQGFGFHFDMEALLRGNISARYEAYAAGRQWGWLSVNNVRKKEGLNPVGPEGDILLQPANMVPLGTKPAESSNTKGVGDDLKGKGNDKIKEKEEDKEAQAGLKPAMTTGNGGAVKQVTPPSIIEVPPGKPKNLNGFDESVVVRP